jgi:hypothetical protein
MADFANSIHDIGRRAGAYKWVELAIASSLSEWIDLIEDHSACALLGSHAHVHASHAEMWHSRLPVLWDRNSTTWINASDDDATIALQQLNADSSTTSTDKVRTMYASVLPALLQTYSAHHATVDPRVDPATVRMLEQCINDLRDHIDQSHNALSRLTP